MKGKEAVVQVFVFLRIIAIFAQRRETDVG